MTAGEPPRRDWTDGPSKWVAALLLGGAAVAGMAWSIFIYNGGPATATVQDRPAHHAAAHHDDAASTSREAARTTRADAPPTGIARLIDLNAASAAELQILPGIGPALAARIVEDRRDNGPYESVDDLQRVRGIGPITVEKLRPMATAR